MGRTNTVERRNRLNGESKTRPGRLDNFVSHVPLSVRYLPTAAVDPSFGSSRPRVATLKETLKQRISTAAYTDSTDAISAFKSVLSL